MIREIYDLGGNIHSDHRREVWVEGEPIDNAKDWVKATWHYTGITHNFYHHVLNYNFKSNGIEKLRCLINYGRGQWANYAKWEEPYLYLGKGDGINFINFAYALDVVAHEISHLVMDRVNPLYKSGQSCAVNEHLADVFGAMCLQWAHEESFDQANWSFGSRIARGQYNAIRRFDRPGTAHIDKYGEEDNDYQQGNYTNYSNLVWQDIESNYYLLAAPLNHLFYLVNQATGGFSWENFAEIWFLTAKSLSSKTSITEFSQELIKQAAYKGYKDLFEEKFEQIGINHIKNT